MEDDNKGGNKQQLKSKQQSNPIQDLFEDQLFTELFNARCHDTGETTNSNYLTFQFDQILFSNLKPLTLWALNFRFLIKI